MRATLALYGNVQIPRGYCPRCKTWAFIIQGIRQCCDIKIDIEIIKRKRMSSHHEKRRTPRKRDRERLLKEFQDACAYCERSFNRFVRYHGELNRTRLTWDHSVPWIHSQDNRGQNFLPACQFCNGWKSSLIFKTLEEVKVYVAQKWEEDHIAYQKQVQAVSEGI